MNNKIKWNSLNQDSRCSSSLRLYKGYRLSLLLTLDAKGLETCDSNKSDLHLGQLKGLEGTSGFFIILKLSTLEVFIY